MRYLAKRRLEHARKLLLKTDMSIREVAGDSGFSSVSNFARGFRQEFGVTSSKLTSQSQLS